MASQIRTTASPNDTVVLAGSTAAIVDASGNTWTITSGGQVAVNGTTETGTFNVKELAYVNGVIWEENTSNLWWSTTSPTAGWSGGSGITTSPLPSITVSEPASETTTVNAAVTLAGISLAEANLASSTVITLKLTASAGTLAMKNAAGTALSGSGSNSITVTGTLANLNADLATLTYSAGSAAGSATINVQASSGSTAASGSIALKVNPAASPNDTVVLAGSTAAIVDASGNTWTITSGGQVAVNGTTEAGTFNVKELAYVNGAIWEENTSNLWWSTTSPTTGWSGGSGITTSPLPSITVSEPASETTTVNTAVTLAGISLAEANLASSTAITLKLTDTSGTLAMKNAAGTALSGSGSNSITVTDTLANLNADLATLTYTAGSTAGSATINVQASSGSTAASATINAQASSGSTAASGSIALKVNPAASPNDTVVLAGSTAAIVDASGSTWTITNGSQVAVNGTAEASTSNVKELAYVNGVIWEENTSNLWSYTTSPSAGWNSGTSPLPSITVSEPASETTTVNTAVTISAISLAEANLASSTVITLKLTASAGTLAMKNAAGTALSGSGGNSITVTDTLANLNVDLATLTYTAGSAAGSATINVQASSGSTAASGSFALKVNPAASPNDTVVLAGSIAAIVDASGNTWTITSGSQVAVNGTAETSTSNVKELAYVNGVIWEENTSNLWSYTTSPSAGWNSGTSPLPSITVSEPASEAATVNTAMTISAISLADANLASSTDITLTLTDTSGTLAMKNAAGTALSGSGTRSIIVTDTLTNLNADLATLIYTAGSTTGSDTISLQAGSGGTTASGATAVKVSSVDASTYLETNNFFASNSPWNTAISSGATYSAVAGMSTVADGLTTWGGCSVAIYYAQTSDPMVEVYENPNTWTEVYDGTWARQGNSASVEQQIMAGSTAINPFQYNPYSTQVNGGSWQQISSGISPYDQTTPLTFYCPADALAANDSDGQTVIIQPDGEAVEMYSPILLSNGNWAAMMYSETNALSGEGTGADNGRRASEVSNYAGAIRDTDVEQGSIDHAMALLAPASMLSAAYDNVAEAFDSSNNGYSGTLPMGSLLALPANINISSLDLQTSLGVEIAEAAKTYGMYLTDRGGSGFSVLVQANPTESALANYSSAEQQDLNSIVHNMQLVHL